MHGNPSQLEKFWWLLQDQLNWIVICEYTLRIHVMLLTSLVFWFTSSGSSDQSNFIIIYLKNAQATDVRLKPGRFVRGSSDHRERCEIPLLNVDLRPQVFYIPVRRELVKTWVNKNKRAFTTYWTKIWQIGSCLSLSRYNPHEFFSSGEKYYFPCEK